MIEMNDGFAWLLKSEPCKAIQIKIFIQFSHRPVPSIV